MAIISPEQTKAMLDAEPKYQISIKKETNNPNYVTERVFVNGFCVQIPVGEKVEVPQTVYEILQEKGVI